MRMKATTASFSGENLLSVIIVMMLNQFLEANNFNILDMHFHTLGVQ